MDFKSFVDEVDEEVELAPLTLLVGANASGKSNFLDALRFLKGLTLDLTVREVLDGEESASSDAWPGIRGGSQEAAWCRESSFSITSTWRAPNDEVPPLYGNEIEREPQHIDITHEITCRISPSIACESEWIERDGFRMPSPFKDDPRSILGTSNLFRLDKGKLDRSLPDDPQSLQLLPLHSLRVAVDAVRFLDIQPAAMREYGRRGAPLGDEGKNLSGVLAALSDDPNVRHSFVAWLQEVCAPELEDLDFVEVEELGDVMAIFIESDGRRVSARSISDGTLRFLGTLLALRTAAPGSVILIEDVEAGLHPTRIRLLVEYLEAVTRERNIQVLATTHSPVVLQWLSDESLRNVIVFGRVPEHEGTLMRRLRDLPHFDETVARTGIEELFTTGWLEMAL